MNKISISDGVVLVLEEIPTPNERQLIRKS